jgi:hypothetical protein
LTSGKLSQFAATSSAELAGVLSDETGTGAAVFGTSPTFTTGIGLAGAGVASFNTDKLLLWGDIDGKIGGKEGNVGIGTLDGGGDFEYVMKAAYNSGNSAFEANYNGSKVLETNADGVNITAGNVYQIEGEDGVTGTYTNANITIKGGIITTASNGSGGSGVIYTNKVPIGHANIASLNNFPVTLVADPGDGYLIDVISVNVQSSLVTDIGDLKVQAIYDSDGDLNYIQFIGRDFGSTCQNGYFKLVEVSNQNSGLARQTQASTPIYLQSENNTLDNIDNSLTVYITYHIITL